MRALQRLLATAQAHLAEMLSRRAATTHEGMLKAMMLKAERAAVRKVKPRGELVAMIDHAGHKGGAVKRVPVYYQMPPVRLNRSRKWPISRSYTIARSWASKATGLTLGVVR